MGFLSGRGLGAATEAFLNSYKMFSDQNRIQEEDDRKKKQQAATAGLLGSVFKGMIPDGIDMENIDPTILATVGNHYDAIRAKQEEIQRKKDEAENTRQFYSRIMPGMIPQDAPIDGVDLGVLKNMYEADQKQKQIALEQKNRIDLENRRFGNDVRLKGVPTYGDRLKERELGGQNGLNGAPTPQGKDTKSWAINAARYYQAKMDRGEALTPEDKTGLALAKAQLDDIRTSQDGSTYRISPDLPVLSSGKDSGGVEQIRKSDIPLTEITKNRERARAVAEVIDSIESLKDHVNKYGLVTARIQNPEAYERQNSIYQSTIMNLKNAEDLGALQQAEIELMNRMLKDPSTIAARFSGKGATTGTYDSLMDTYKRRLSSFYDLTDGQVDGNRFLESMRQRRNGQKGGGYSSSLPQGTGIKPYFGGN